MSGATAPAPPGAEGPPATSTPAVWFRAAAPPSAAALESGGVDPRLAELLARRGVGSLEAADRFLTPSLDHLHDPLRLHGMPQAIARLLAAREAGEAVAVVGDYDADGVTATALLTAVLGACGVTAHAILPHRLHEGYGFQEVHVDRAIELGCRLIVTVDCGVTSGPAVTHARTAGLDVVITDHHLPGPGLPEGTVLVNPRQELCDYPFAGLAGVGLALKLALAFAAACDRRIAPERLLRIACLGTIADMVPLVDENRAIAALGLRALASTPSPGLRALFRCAGVKPPFRAADVAFRLGPRLNAAGRLADAATALELLVCRDAATAEGLAGRLDDLNSARRAEERRVVDEAREALAARDPLPALAIAWRDGWHRGVLGIAAGRLARELHRPVILLGVADGEAVGSGRSVPGVSLHDFLARWRGELARFGGHDQAIGLTVALADDPSRIDRLAATWEEAAAEWPPELLAPRHEYELEVPPHEVDDRLLRLLARLEPHGTGNPQPLLRVGPMTLAMPPRRFGDGHLSAIAAGPAGGRLGLLGWGWGEREADLAGSFEVLGHLEYDDYRQAPVVRLVDARPA